MSTPPPHSRPTARIVIRDLDTHAEYIACLGLQREVWGSDFQDCVTPALLKVTQRVGGVAAGAFDGDDLVGFVYGMTGWADGSLLHWSHMLAVAPRARGAGVGRRLKEYQRDAVARTGAKVMAWSFDPLVARNAHLNLNVLGAKVSEYVESMYAPTESELHGSLPVDRFVVRWQLDGVPAAAAPVAPAAPTPAAAAAAEPESTGPAVTLDWRAPGADGGSMASDALEVRIPVPRDFEQLLRSSERAASEARIRTRSLFQRTLDDGWKVVGFERGSGQDPYYVLRRDGR